MDSKKYINIVEQIWKLSYTKEQKKTMKMRTKPLRQKNQSSSGF